MFFYLICTFFFTNLKKSLNLQNINFQFWYTSGSEQFQNFRKGYPFLAVSSKFDLILKTYVVNSDNKVMNILAFTANITRNAYCFPQEKKLIFQTPEYFSLQYLNITLICLTTFYFQLFLSGIFNGILTAQNPLYKAKSSLVTQYLDHATLVNSSFNFKEKQC